MGCPPSQEDLAYISPISRLHLAYISPTSRLHLAYTSPISPYISEQEGVDFAGCIDLSGLTRVFNPRYSSYTHFGLDHVATAWRAPRPHLPMPPPPTTSPPRGAWLGLAHPTPPTSRHRMARALPSPRPDTPKAQPCSIIYLSRRQA